MLPLPVAVPVPVLVSALKLAVGAQVGFVKTMMEVTECEMKPTLRLMRPTSYARCGRPLPSAPVDGNCGVSHARGKRTRQQGRPQACAHHLGLASAELPQLPDRKRRVRGATRAPRLVRHLDLLPLLVLLLLLLLMPLPLFSPLPLPLPLHLAQARVLLLTRCL